MLRGFTPGVALAGKTTFQVGGPATYFATATTVTELQTLLTTAYAAEQPVTIIGGGSNVLVADTGVAGCVIAPAMRDWTDTRTGTTVHLTVGAGMVFDDLVAQTVARGWWGLENLSHIPGWVGATPIQNVGAYGVEVSDRIISVTALHKETLEVRTFTHAECDFGYRDSWFKTAAGRAWVVTQVTFQLSTEPTPELSYRDLHERFADATPQLADIRQAVVEIRAAKFPDWHTVGTAGSFFKNPIVSAAQYTQLQQAYPDLPGYPLAGERVKVALGWLLDKACALRGHYQGPVGCYESQALVLVQTGGATATEITRFAHFVAEEVFAKTGITIEWEVTPMPYQA